MVFNGRLTEATVSFLVAAQLQQYLAACVSNITVRELTTFLHCSLMSEMDYIGEYFGCFTACDIKCSHSIIYHSRPFEA